VDTWELAAPLLAWTRGELNSGEGSLEPRVERRELTGDVV